ncbi:NfeD family protein [Litorilituus lipolyticus]|uniref:NfeD family protein n=1 Tax=Litorilituus lipolyticus TaxID=2491017 RepID=A0A502KPB4_9GAMM|nr:NfeD family protein [Litorilituus lipolyticus]TPH13462.1 NfeD family protein [Litorilituus lipolyticus]
MEYFLENHHHLWFLIAGISFIIELSIMGLSGPLLFFAIASVITGILVTAGVLTSWQMEILSVGIVSALTALVLWKPLKNLQNSRSKTDTSSDMIGLKVPITTDITATSGNIRYSGINWNARLADDASVDVIPSAQQCQIVAVSGNTMLVKPV